MTRPISFNCHAFLDNDTLCILEISLQHKSRSEEHQYHWLIVNKNDLTVRPLKLKSTDSSPSVKERFFDLGYLKYDATTGVFIEVSATEFHPLENKNCNQVPDAYLNVVESYLINLRRNDMTWIF